MTPTKGPDDQLCLRKLTSGSSTPLVRSYSRVDNHRAADVYARAAYHPAYLRCCIPGMQHTHIRPPALPRYAGMQRYATGMQYASMQRYAVCNSMHSPSVSDATASFQLTPSGATAQPIAACIRDIAPGPRSSNPTSLNNVDHALKHLVEPPRCIACLLESPACQKKPPTLSRGPRSTTWQQATAPAAGR